MTKETKIEILIGLAVLIVIITFAINTPALYK
jgi:putative copper export protein